MTQFLASKKRGIKEYHPYVVKRPLSPFVSAPYLSNFCQCCQILLRKSYFYCESSIFVPQFGYSVEQLHV